ncbi:LysR family transcriptional regulator [Roseomonas sp. BN140053]|uniref:LysR family transcriptional regulator n=1 Tax=Roseomonas sp. BN140053 TaxID=3391898 RepID=UPI0039EAA412
MDSKRMAHLAGAQRHFPQLTLQKLEVFCRVVELGSVTRAAEEMGVAQPAVTAHLRDLEEKLGVQIVQRVGRHLVLTEAGSRFHRWSSEILTRTLEMSRELSSLNDGAAGEAVIAASMTVGTYALTEILVEYQREHPNTCVSTLIANTRLATEAARTGECDFAVLLLDTRQDLKGLELEPLWEEQLVLVATGSDNRIGVDATASDLSRLPFVTTPRVLVRRNLEDQALYARGIVNRRVVLELGHPEAIKRAVLAGAGVAFVEETAVREEVGRGELRILRTPGFELRMPLVLAHRRGKVMTEMQLGLMMFIKRWRRPPPQQP